MIPYYLEKANTLKIPLPKDITEAIDSVEAISKGHTEDEDEAIAVDKLTAPRIKALIKEKEGRIKEAQDEVNEHAQREELLKTRAKKCGLEDIASESAIVIREKENTALSKKLYIPNDSTWHEITKKLKKDAKKFGLPEDASVEDILAAEAAEKKQGQRAEKAGLASDAKLEEIEEAEKAIKALRNRAIKVDLEEDATEEEIIAAEEAAGAGSQKAKGYFTKRAKKLELPEDATLDDIEAEEARRALIKRAKKLELADDATEEECEAKEAELLSERAEKAGLPADATIEQIKKAENSSVSERALAIGLAADATKKEVVEAEKAASLVERAKAVDLSEDATEEEVAEKEKGNKSSKLSDLGLGEDATEEEIAAKEEELKGIGKDGKRTNAQVLEFLYKKGKKSVTKAELKDAGFNVGFWGPLSDSGNTRAGNYRLNKSYDDTEWTLVKLA